MRKRAIIILTILLGIIFLETLVLIHMRSELVDLVAQLEEVQTETIEWQGRNGVLKEEYLKRTSLTWLAEEAARQGFVPAHSLLLAP